MQHKTFRKRQGISLKKTQAFNLIKNIEIQRQKDQEKTIKASSNKFTSIKDIWIKTQTPRSKTTRHSKYQSNPYIDSNPLPKKPTSPKPVNKFAKLHLNSRITHCDQNIHHLVQQITPKAKAFYRFGMKSYEKPSHKRVYSDMMNLPPQSNKGAIYIGELWTNDMSNRFLKLNKMNMNKLKFFEKLRDLKWEGIAKERQKQLDSSNLISSVKDFSQKSLKSFPTISHFQSLLSLKYFKQASQDSQKQNLPLQKQTQKLLRLQKYQRNSHQYKQVLNAIRNTIDQQTVRCRSQNYWKDMKNLQSQSHQMHKLWDKYFAKMLQISS